MCCQGVRTGENANLANEQNELLLWHWKLRNSIHWTQEIMHVNTTKEPVIEPKFASSSNCPLQKLPCELAHDKNFNPQVL